MRESGSTPPRRLERRGQARRIVVILVEREAAEVVNPLPIDLEGRRAAARTRLAAWPAAAAAGACSQEPSDAAELKCLRRLPL